jgi:hypothetical protein
MAVAKAPMLTGCGESLIEAKMGMKLPLKAQKIYGSCCCCTNPDYVRLNKISGRMGVKM